MAFHTNNINFSLIKCYKTLLTILIGRLDNTVLATTMIHDMFDNQKVTCGSEIIYKMAILQTFQQSFHITH